MGTYRTRLWWGPKGTISAECLVGLANHQPVTFKCFLPAGHFASFQVSINRTAVNNCDFTCSKIFSKDTFLEVETLSHKVQSHLPEEVFQVLLRTGR